MKQASVFKFRKDIVEDYKFCLRVASEYLKEGCRLPKEFAEAIKLLAEVGGVPEEMRDRLEAVLDYISSPHFGIKKNTKQTS